GRDHRRWGGHSAEHADGDGDADCASAGETQDVDVPSVTAADVTHETAVERRQQRERLALEVDVRLLEAVQAGPSGEPGGIRVRDLPQISSVRALRYHERTR